MEKEAVMISVIIPIYNVKEYLSKCLDSLKNQTYPDFEALLVDDGSTDGSEKICDEYAKEDNRFVVIHKQNSGVSDARNIALERAKGKYITFLDSDDWLEPNAYEVLYSHMEKHNPDVVFGVCERIYRQYFDNEPDHSVQIIENEDVLTSYIKPDYKPHILKALWDKLYTKEIIGDVRFKPGHHRDGTFNTEVLSKAKKVIFAGELIYHYRDERPGSISNTGITERIFTDKIPVLTEQIEVLEHVGRKDLAERQRVMFYSEMLAYYVKIYKSSVDEKKEFMERIGKLLMSDKKKIKESFVSSYATNSYKCKMRLFLLSPSLYGWILSNRKREDDATRC